MLSIELCWGGAMGGPGARSDFRNWTGARSAKEKIGRSSERQMKKGSMER